MRWSMRCILVAILGLLALPAAARAAPPDPSGLWSTGPDQAVVQVYYCGSDTLCGALVGFALNGPADPTPHTWNGRSQCRFVFISGLRPRTRAWFGGITNPQSGHRYSAKIRLMSPDRLRLRGYFLLPMLGATRFWTRYEGPQPPADCRMGPHALG
jgi:uncharacterized protein (DUF2147 family)